MNVNIRRAIETDWPIIQKLNNEVFVDNAIYDPNLDLTYPFSKAGIAHYKEAASSSKLCCFIAFDKDVPVGLLVGGPKKLAYRKKKMSEIIELGVSPGYRSHGIGARLIDEFRHWSKENGYQIMMVSCYYSNNKAISFYKKCGLTPIDISFEGKV